MISGGGSLRRPCGLSQQETTDVWNVSPTAQLVCSALIKREPACNSLRHPRTHSCRICPWVSPRKDGSPPPTDGCQPPSLVTVLHPLEAGPPVIPTQLFLSEGCLVSPDDKSRLSCSLPRRLLSSLFLAPRTLTHPQVPRHIVGAQS